ncbi:MAG TPA: Holliday junction branch migration protein RuvA [Amoebophilaceae bacterium]|jgi:Holliday junction DNA helicase RuvA|nr:Holliday junction branch migration protein RuvA [Amoebophilaceae bacterium]
MPQTLEKAGEGRKIHAMIAQLTGKILEKDPTQLILEVGGVGYALHISLHTFDQIKTLDTCTILTILQVKNDTCVLYGFYTLEEKEWWLRLTSITSIGAKTALTLLSSLHPNALHQAILTKDEKLLSSIKGIGIKAVRRIIVELSDKVAPLNGVAQLTGAPDAYPQNQIDADAAMALVRLGLTQKNAEKAVATTRVTYPNNPLTLEELVRKALQTS